MTPTRKSPGTEKPRATTLDSASAPTAKGAKRSILTFLPPHLTPRPGQVQALLAVEANWDKAEVFVINAPVAAGKSLLATTIAKWATSGTASATMDKSSKALIVPPNNMLLQQYLDSNPRMATLWAKDHYQCVSSREGATCKEIGSALGKPCCRECPYTKANRLVRAVPWAACNAYTYLAHGLYADTVLFDEAHGLLGMVRDLAAKKLWRRVYGYPASLQSYRDLLRWVGEALEERPGDAKLVTLKADLESGANRYLVERGEDTYFGKPAECLKLLPVDTSKQPPFLWPGLGEGGKGKGKVSRVILLSATIGPKDLEQLGLNRKRVAWIETPSPIDKSRRPCYIESGFDVSARASPEDAMALVTRIAEIAAAHPGQKGVIHATYQQARTLMGYLPAGVRERVLSHDNRNKADIYRQFIESGSESGRILLASGMYEGLDLVGDLARWQVIAKVPWPHLGEPAWKWLSESDPERYGWEALKLVVQAYGRVCRGPTDFGETYILDRSFSRLDLGLAPSWFREACIYV